MRRFLLGILVGILGPVLALLLIARLGLVPVHATEEPPTWELKLARMAVDTSVARSAPQLRNPIDPSDAELLAGMKLYRNNCSGCHGDAGRPSPWGSSGFYPRVPQFAQSPPRKPDWQLFWIVRHGIRYSGMGAWREAMLPDKEAWEVIAFLSHLNTLPANVQATWQGDH